MPNQTRHRRFQNLGLFALAVAVFCAMLHPLAAAQERPAGATMGVPPQPRVEPLMLHDTDDTERYVSEFPFSKYEQHRVPKLPWQCPFRGGVHCLSNWLDTPYIGRFLIEAPPIDPIKEYIVNGLIWEPHVVESLADHVVPGTVALDVGAYIGTHAMLMARLVGPRGRVYAFKPQRKIYRELRHNIALNDLNNIVPLRYAIGPEVGVVEMSPPLYGYYEGGVQIGTGGEQAELRTLDSFGFENVSLIKIDVEGYENQVLAGAENLIRASKPVILIEILGGKSYPGVPNWWIGNMPASPQDLESIHVTWRLIEAFGYEVRPVSSHDYIALPVERPDD